MHHSLRVAVVAIATLLSSTALAATVGLNGTSSLSMQFDVTDLTPDDGQAAGFLFGPRDSSYTATVEFASGSDYGHKTHTATPTFDVPVHVVQKTGPQVLELHGTTSFGDIRTVHAGSTTGGGSHGLTLSTVSQSTRILLKARSALSISGLSELSFFHDDVPWSYSGASASMSSTLGASLDYVSIGAPSVTFEDAKNFYAYYGTPAGTDSYRKAFTLNAVNDNDYDIELALQLDYEVGTYARINPVPEPGAYLMLAVGGLLLAGRQRWRTRGGQSA
ncbi:PEP-CTERM sorting domain-containing protein [Pseudoduganella armeniaca]|uniref:PEP-CTERM sorting domain-containing protein n=1 Tax=Pseudoduganella armeniaca TaxID=2072590 RepID=A0A2R4CG69_9BURK|nr:PEP-CTERM sorting domain-containing protein [Pseudoduganella armeniaca]AVR98616.1 hypothetical protein C9I28_25525 [Pseudoduganella armeniaca]